MEHAALAARQHRDLGHRCLDRRRAISTNGDFIAARLEDGTGGVWSQSGDNQLFSLEGQGAEINTVSFSPDGSRLVDADDQGYARIYRSGEPWLLSLPMVAHSCGAEFRWQPHKLLGLTQTGDSITLQTWSLPSFRPTAVTTVFPSGQSNECSAVSPDGRLVALWDGDPTSTVSVLDVATRKIELTLPTMVVQAATFSDDGRLMAVASGTGELLVTNLATHGTVSSGGWPKQCPLTRSRRAGHQQ